MAQARELGAPLVGAGQEQSVELGDVEAGSTACGSVSSPSPLQGSFLARTFLTWVFPLLRRSATVEQLQTDDLFSLPPSSQPEPLHQTFIAAWREQLRRNRGRRRQPKEGRSLMRVIWRVNFDSMRILWFVRLLETLLDFAYPLFLNLLLRFASDASVPRSRGLLYALLLFACQGFQVILDIYAKVGMDSLGLRIRCSLITAVFKKVVLLRQDSLQSFSSGTLNNMITTDVDKVRRVLRYLHIMIISAPIKIVICLVSLHKLVGVAIWISLSWMAIVIMINPAVMWVMGKMQDKLQSRTDERVRKATEVISAIQVIKCYAWEEPSTAKVEESRRLELLSMWRLYCIYTLLEGFWSSVVPVTTAIMFAAYSALNPDDPLTAEKAFTAMTLINMVQDPLFTIPWVLNLIVEALVSSKRLERLFVLPEACLPSTAGLASFCLEDEQGGARDSNGSERPGGVGEAADPACELDDSAAVGFENASFMWPQTAQREGEEGAEEEEGEAAARPGAGGGDQPSEAPAAEFRLSDLTFRVQKGALVAVVGATASGKTSLLHAVLGEMPVVEGEEQGRALVRRHRPIAFAPQQPWIFNGTVRQNILFGEAYAEQRYLECLRCCDLEKDLALLKDGDQTKVGERGIALSGGQKARVCLARAAYRQSVSGLFLLDDPYSALDAHVARKIHEEAVRGLLAKKTRLVATNRLEFVSSCDMVLVLEGGRLEAIGKYDEVRKSSASLRSLFAAQGLEAGEEHEDAGDVPPQPPDFQRQFSRALSYTSANSDDERQAAAAAQVNGQPEDQDESQAGGEEEEARASGQVNKEVVLYYLRNMGGPFSVAALASIYLLAEAAQLAMPIWLAHWTTANPSREQLGRFLGPYVVLSLATVVMMTGRDLMGNVYGFRAARRLHAAMFAAVLRAPMSFFQDTPQGRIINRFSKDMNEIDQELIWQMVYTIVPLINIIGNFGMVGLTSVFSVLVFVPLLWLYVQVWKYYNKAALDIKRLSKVTSSPVYDHFNNLCRENAISIVRAHRQVERQCRISDGLVTEQQRTEYSQIYTESWFSMRMDHLGCTLVLSVALCVVWGRGSFISASSAALALTFSQECSSAIENMIGQLAEFGMAFNCVERVKEYCTALSAEAPALSEHRPPEGWPTAGELEVRNLRLRYRPGLPLVLQGLNFHVAPGERLGVCGRTGAGKSSLLLALLRIAEPEEGSEIRLDGQDLLALGLRDVRSNIAMIPQDPVLFQETLRYNCDPFGEHTAERVWEAIEEAQLAPWVRERGLASASATASSLRSSDNASSSSLSVAAAAASAAAGARAGEPALEDKETMLKMEIKEGGQNLSAGQRQMVAIARAVLRRARLVVLDEATAAVDAATDAAIQLAVRRCFAGASTLTIAHRLQTIADSDRVLVLADGLIAELGPPGELRAKEGGIFRGMTEEAEQ